MDIHHLYQVWRHCFFQSQRSLSWWSTSCWHWWSGPLGSRFLHNKSVVVLKKTKKTKTKGVYNLLGKVLKLQITGLKLRVKMWPYLIFNVLEGLYANVVYLRIQSLREIWQGETNVTKQELNGVKKQAVESVTSVLLEMSRRTVPFAGMSNFGWRLKGTPSRAAESEGR